MSVTIWTPSGMVNPEVRKVDRAVNEYDERLSFQRNEYYEWVIVMSMPHGEAPLPILNFGREVPSPGQAVQRLRNADALKRGVEILDAINRHNDEIHWRKELEVREAQGHFIEAVESAAHRYGGTGYHRSLPKKDPKQRSTK